MRRVTVVGLVMAALVVASPVLAGGRPLSADLAAANEVGGGDGTATGSASFWLNQGQGEICFTIETDGLTAAPFAAHIHTGPAGVNGGVVVDLDWSTNGDADSADGCVWADADVIKDIRQHPDQYYVNVHNATVPSGAVRGQLSK